MSDELSQEDQDRIRRRNIHKELNALWGRLPAADAEIVKIGTEELMNFRRLDREAATHVETVICLRTGFTGDEPYVGWRASVWR